ncbi:MAG: ABC transporter ATP-binding protein [Rhodoferax sp.]|nr:ABC transporter ATP-binding protein [Rhodoferax sp.]
MTPQERAKAAGPENFLQVINVIKKFGAVTVVNQLNLSIRQKEVFALLGSSGCGKSTLLRMMAGLEPPTSGQILLDGQDITHMPPHERPVNMMFQSYALFPHMSVSSNVGYGLRCDGVAKAEIADRVRDALAMVQMSQYANHKPGQLSGGQQQRVALARSLVKQPKLLLLDEPMSALDKNIRQKTQFELGNILFKVGVTCVMVTHDQEEAMTMADRIAVMNQGHIVQVGSPEQVYEAPSSRFAAEFIGSTNILNGVVVTPGSSDLHCAEISNGLRLPNPIGLREGHELMVTVRPERISMVMGEEQQAAQDAGEPNSVLGVVEQIAYMGSYTLFHVRLACGRVLVVNTSRSVLMAFPRQPDYRDTVLLKWSPRSMIVLE